MAVTTSKLKNWLQTQMSDDLRALSAVVMAFVFAFASDARAADASSARSDLSISKIDDTTQLEFVGSFDGKYSLKRDAGRTNELTLSLPSLRSEVVSKLKSYSDDVVKAVKISEGIDGRVDVTFSVAEKADYFDYFTDQPNRLIVDFFPKDGARDSSKAKVKDAALPQSGSAKSTEAASRAAQAADAKALAKHAVVKKPSDEVGDEDDDVADRTSDSVNDSANDHALASSARDISDQITGQAGAHVSDSGKRKPAASDLPLRPAQDEPPSLAEQISSKENFEHGIFDGGDPEFKRFAVKDFEVREESVIASKANYYLPFPMLTLGNPQLQSLIEAKPTYEIVPNETRENKDARVLMTLFSTGKQSLFLQTSTEFLNRYPGSAYDEIVRYMVADTYFELGKRDRSPAETDRAMRIYQLLTEKYPDSVATPRTILLMGYSYLAKGDSFAALRNFEKFMRTQPNSKHIDQVRISAAEAYLRLARYDDAYAMLSEVEKNAKSEKMRAEAAYRKGDVFFRKRDWERAITEYKQAVQKFPDGAKKFANAPYNIAEAEFNLSRYRESLDSYRSFLQKFPENEHGGYAMTRVAEILGILGIDSSRVQGAFLESFFRYRASPGAGVARIRLLTSRMSEMKDKELADALKEIDDITFRYANHPVDQLPKIRVKLGLEPNANAQNDARPSEAKAAESSAEGKPEQRKPASEAKAGAEKVASEFEDVRDAPPELPGIEDFTKLWTSDGFTARHDFDRATKDLIAYYQKFPQSPNKQKIRDRIVRNMSLAIAASVDHGEFIDALHRWSRDSVLWLKNTDRIGVRYDVGRAYEQAGVYKEAASIYSDNIKELAALQSSGKERERRVFDQMPNKDEVNLRLAAVASKQNEFNTAASYLRNIEGSSNLSDPEKIERAEISADVAEARGQADLASKYMTDLINTWKGRAELTSSLHLRIAKLQTKKRNLKDADSHLAKIIEMQKETSKVPEDVHAKALELRAELFVSRGQPQQAVQTITDLLELYETKRPLASMRYRLGQILFQDGDLKGAQNAWASLDGAKDGLWAHLAQEQMESEKWQREYKKYLTRIPAAQSLR